MPIKLDKAYHVFMIIMKRSNAFFPPCAEDIPWHLMSAQPFWLLLQDQQNNVHKPLFRV